MGRREIGWRGTGIAWHLGDVEKSYDLYINTRIWTFEDLRVGVSSRLTKNRGGRRYVLCCREHRKGYCRYITLERKITVASRSNNIGF